MPMRRANCRTGAVKISDANKAIEKAIQILDMAEYPEELTRGQHALQTLLDLLRSAIGEIPVHRPPQTITEIDLRLKTEKLLGESVIRDAVCRTRWHIAKKLEVRFFAGVFEDKPRGGECRPVDQLQLLAIAYLDRIGL